MSMINLKSLVLKDGKRKRNTKTKKEGERGRERQGQYVCVCEHWWAKDSTPKLAATLNL